MRRFSAAPAHGKVGCNERNVLHLATGERLTIDADPATALDVYYHPFAYCLDGGRELAAVA
jgi:hypothetical protein